MTSPQAADGTARANQLRPMDGSLYRAVRDARFQVVATRMQRSRLYVALPLYAVLFTMLWKAGVSLPRVLVLATLIVGNQLQQLFVLMAARGRSVSLDWLFVGPLIAQGVQLGVVAVTGGLASPLLPIVLTVLMSVTAGMGRGARTYLVFAITAVGMVVLMLLPAWVVGPAFSRPWYVALVTWSLVSAMTHLWIHLFPLTDAYQAAGEEIARMREDVVQQAIDRARSIEAVGAKVGHELKNPLAAIKGLVQLLARQATDDRSRERFGVMGSEVARMETIVREYLSFSRPLEDLLPERLDAGALIDEVLRVLDARARVAGVELSRSGDGVMLSADPRKLREALLNLTANAVEASPAGGTVTVGLARRGDSVEIAIRDQGKGLAPDQLERLGTPFHTTREGGTGLGVVLARTAIVQHGGALIYESEPGRGTVARVTLPLSPPANPTAIAEVARG